MFGLSGEHLILFVALLFIFGPTKLPQLGTALGKTMRNFKNGARGEKDAEFKRLSEKDLDEK